MKLNLGLQNYAIIIPAEKSFIKSYEYNNKLNSLRMYNIVQG
jgi:hypothetical protein